MVNCFYHRQEDACQKQHQVRRVAYEQALPVDVQGTSSRNNEPNLTMSHIGKVSHEPAHLILTESGMLHKTTSSIES